jgi:hypothetical protein
MTDCDGGFKNNSDSCSVGLSLMPAATFCSARERLKSSTNKESRVSAVISSLATLIKPSGVDKTRPVGVKRSRSPSTRLPLVLKMRMGAPATGGEKTDW